MIVPFNGMVMHEVDPPVLSNVAKGKQTSTGPMRTQPADRGSLLPTPVQPIMPMFGKATIAPYPKERPTRSEAVRAAKAKIMRRNSLRKQRDAQAECRAAGETASGRSQN
jgi:hypothetical protein